MRSIMRHPAVAASAFAAAGLIFVACSESPTGPSTRGPIGAQATVVGSLPALGTPKLTIASGDAAVHYCGYAATETPVLGTFTGVDCGSAANDLTAAMLVYNPGWSQPFTNSKWIGPTAPDAPSSDYSARVGTYEFVTTFHVDAGVTSPALQLSAKADNAVVVYLNGVKIGQHAFLQDCTVQQAGACNWNVPLLMDNTESPLQVNADNVLRIDLVGTLIGRITDGVSTPTSTCAQLPQLQGTAGFTGTLVNTSPDHQTGGVNWDVGTCLNPTGLDFITNVFWTVPSAQWCSPGFWKTHPGTPPWPAGYQTKGYNDFSGVYSHAPFTISGNPSLLTVVSNPKIYGGPATNNVGDVLSNVVFGTPIGSTADDTFCNNGVPLT